MNRASVNRFGKQQLQSIAPIQEQQILFSEESLLPATLPRRHELHPATNLSAIFDECHNHIYANEGLLKDKIFHEIVKLLVMKLYDEQQAANGKVEFGVTAGEYRSILEGTPTPFEKRMKELFALVCVQYGALFLDEALRLKPLSLAFVAGRLQYISLTQTPGDVKGEAFQAFVYRNQRGDRGEFFTPHPVVRLAVEMLAPTADERVIDPTCGSGGFLIQTISYLADQNPDFDRTAYVQQNLRGIEFNPDVALSAMIRLAFEGGTGAEITCANALLAHEQFEGAFDVVLTNPPFGSKGKVEDLRMLSGYLLARRWTQSASDEWEMTNSLLPGQSPEILLIEKCLKMLRPGGRMAVVLPDGLLQNISNSHIRFWIRSQAVVLGVVSIPQEAFIPYGTGIKTSLLLLQKEPAQANDVFMARLQKIGYDVKGQPIYKRDDKGKLLRSAQGGCVVDDDIQKIATAYRQFRQGQFVPDGDAIFPVPEALLNNRLDVEHYHPDDLKLLRQLQANGAKPLREIADILTKSDDFRSSSADFMRYIAISDVDARAMQVVSQQILKPHEAPSRATYRIQTGDIITATSGASTGTERQATALITEDEDGAICSNGFAVIRNIHGVEPFFLLAFMRTDYFLRQVSRLTTGHAIPAISTEDFGKLLVPLPPPATQRQIAGEMTAILTLRKEAMRASEKIIDDTQTLIGRSISAFS